MSRSTFAQLRIWTLAFVCVTAVSVGCGGSGSTTAPPPAAPPPVPPPPPPPPPPANAGDVSGVVMENHPLAHIAVVTVAQLAAAKEITIDIQGLAFHSHTITLTADKVRQIAQKTRVTVESTINPHSNGTDPHKHTVVFN